MPVYTTAKDERVFDGSCFKEWGRGDVRVNEVHADQERDDVCKKNVELEVGCVRACVLVNSFSFPRQVMFKGCFGKCWFGLTS